MAKEVKASSSSREHFGSKFGFILACIGSAVGMGNIWLFPYRVGQFGGAAFLIPYLIFVVLIGYTGVIGEMAFGRAMEAGPLGAFDKALKRRGKNYGGLIGMIPVLGSLGIAIGYSVVMGWILRFSAGAIGGSLLKAQSSGAYFGSLTENFGSLGWHFLALFLTFFIMAAGISSGIERINKVLMPAFFGLFLLLGIYVFTLPGSAAGYSYLFKPNWSALGNLKTWVFALGQAFFSLSLAGSGTLVYGSYLNKEEDILHSAGFVAVFDTLAALLSAMVILPAVFAFGMDPGAGPGLMFVTMPEIFKQMPLGAIFSLVFFVAVLFAGITSLVNLFESPIEALQYHFKMSRPIAVALVLILAAVVGVFIEEGGRLGLWMDVVSIYVIPLGALLAGIMFYWVCGMKFAREQLQMGREKPIGPWLEPAAKYLFVGLTILVYILGIFYGGIG
ncbi:MAG: sodium-dependent transporter [Tissierellia bacterium]|nr:sodium-dependent transporter [Tissierellia bacterium]